jgi:hypothetical protein
MPNRHGVDFAEIVKNAADQGIDLNEITLIYEDVSDEELIALQSHNLVATRTARCVLGKFNKEGLALFPDKVTGVYSLSA